MTRITLRDRHGHRISAIATAVRRGSPAVILVHGLTSQKGRYAPWAAALRRRGIGSLRIDLYGHGESDGTLAEMTPTELRANAEAALRFLEARRVSSIGIAGGSLGGMVSLLAASDHPRIRAIALFAPASVFPWVDKRDPCSKRWGDPRCTNAHRFLSAAFVRDAKRTRISARMRRARQPMLVFHGTRDEAIPLAHSRSLASAAGAKLVVLRGASHVLRRQPRAVQRRVIEGAAAWFSHHLS